MIHVCISYKELLRVWRTRSNPLDFDPDQGISDGHKRQEVLYLNLRAFGTLVVLSSSQARILDGRKALRPPDLFLLLISNPASSVF